MRNIEDRVQNRLEMYKKEYAFGELNNSNDMALLMSLIRSELVVEDLQKRLFELVNEGDLVENAPEIKKLSDLTRDMVDQNMEIQKTLQIDRKSRKSGQDNFFEYLTRLKISASEFLEKRLKRIYCPDCKVMVARFAPVHEHTAFELKVQCSQCKKMIEMQRKEQDPLFDIPDRDWRTKRAVVVQPSNVFDETLTGEEEDVDYGSEGEDKG